MAHIQPALGTLGCGCTVWVLGSQTEKQAWHRLATMRMYPHLGAYPQKTLVSDFCRPNRPCKTLFADSNPMILEFLRRQRTRSSYRRVSNESPRYTAGLIVLKH